jgi:hypothetical protein
MQAYLSRFERLIFKDNLVEVLSEGVCSRGSILHTSLCYYSPCIFTIQFSSTQSKTSGEILANSK